MLNKKHDLLASFRPKSLSSAGGGRQLKASFAEERVLENPRRPGGPPHYFASFKIMPASVATHSVPSPAARNMARTAVAR